MRRMMVIVTLLLASAGAWALPGGLLFHASFDKLTTVADFSAGEGKSTFTASLDLRSAEGVKGAGLLQQRGERCSYPVAGNFDTSKGTYSVWVKPLSWDGHGKKFRHFLAVDCGPEYRMLLYLYPIGDENVTNFIQTNAKTPQEATSRAGAPVDILPRNEWTHLVSTWDASGLRLYANGKRVGEGLLAGTLQKLDKGTFTICPVEYWAHPQWGDPEEQTICDEVRVFDHALTDEEVLDLYALDVPGGLADLKPSLAVTLKPDYFGKKLEVTVKPAHLDKAWEGRIKQAAGTLTVTDPAGKVLHEAKGALPGTAVVVPVATWVDGEYKAVASATAGGEALEGQAVVVKPPTPWLPAQKDWRADRVLEPWTGLKRDGQTIKYWNGAVSLPGALPAQISAAGQGMLAGPVRLMAEEAATWNAPKVTEDKDYRVTVRRTGKAGALAAKYETLMEFDGLVRTDLTLTPPAGGADVAALTLEIPLRAEVAKYYRNPVCREWDGKALEEKEFLPYGWLGNEQRGLSWFMESAANWRIGKDQPAVTLRREGDTVVVRLRLISEPTRVTAPLTYTLGLEATPVRPPSNAMYDQRFASGPQLKGANLFVYGWSEQISYLNGRLIAHDPADQRKLVDKWRQIPAESLSYSCTQCTANLSPEYQFFGEEWHQPYGGSFSGYKRVPDNAPYSIVPVCPQSSFPDFLVWCAKQNLDNDWGGGIYTDIDGAIPCDNARHGCGYTDVFGKTGRTWPLYAHRSVSRRLYAACHDHGKLYFAHAHSNWYSLFNAFNDGWCPGEQYGAVITGKPYFYMDEIPDRTWRTEFYSPTTGAPSFLLPELSRFSDDALKQAGPSESCIVAAMCYGVPLWAGSIRQETVADVWAVQQAFGMRNVSFVPFWEQQEFVTSDPEVRVSYWTKPGERLVVVSNFTGQERTVKLTARDAGATWEPAWKGEGAQAAGASVTVKVGAKNGALLRVKGMQR
ncbi:MAG: glycoside hydrolase domain-containing protein [Armatimonadia bacterium]